MARGTQCSNVGIWKDLWYIISRSSHKQSDHLSPCPLKAVHSLQHSDNVLKQRAISVPKKKVVQDVQNIPYFKLNKLGRRWHVWLPCCSSEWNNREQELTVNHGDNLVMGGQPPRLSPSCPQHFSHYSNMYPVNYNVFPTWGEYKIKSANVSFTEFVLKLSNWIRSGVQGCSANRSQ